MKKEISIGIFAFNEEEHLSSTVKNILQALQKNFIEIFEIIIVNDGSKDKTENVILELEQHDSRICHITHKENLGIGISLRGMLKKAKYKYFTTFPGDDNATFELMMNLFSHLGDADFIITYLPTSHHRGKFRRFISNVFHLLYCCSFGLPLRYINGNTILRTSHLKELELNTNGYSILAEIAVKIIRGNQGTLLQIPGPTNPTVHKSSALRLVVLKEVISSYIHLMIDVYIKNPGNFRLQLVDISSREGNKKNLREKPSHCHQ